MWVDRLTVAVSLGLGVGVAVGSLLAIRRERGIEASIAGAAVDSGPEGLEGAPYQGGANAADDLDEAGMGGLGGVASRTGPEPNAS
jgi:hypothetical protein